MALGVKEIKDEAMAAVTVASLRRAKGAIDVKA